MKAKASVLVWAAGVWAMTAAGADTGAARPAASAAVPASGEKPVCTYEMQTGSHLRKKVCMTEAQREERRRLDEDRMRNLHDRTEPLKAAP